MAKVWQKIVPENPFMHKKAPKKAVAPPYYGFKKYFYLMY